MTLSSDGNSISLPVHSLSQSKETNEVIPHQKQGAASVCVRALYGPYNNIRQMGKHGEDKFRVESDMIFSGQFISFYSAVLGVKMFTFYLLDATDKIKYLLGKILFITQYSQTIPDLRGAAAETRRARGDCQGC